MSDTQGTGPDATPSSETTPEQHAAPANDASVRPEPQIVPPRPPMPSAQPSASQTPAQSTPQAPTGAGAQTGPVPPHSAPAPTAPQGSYPAWAGAAPAGAAFGAGATGTQPTLPYGGYATPPAPPAPSSKAPRVGAGRVAGLIVAAALVGGAAGLGGAYAGVNIWGASQTSAVAGPTTVTVNDTDSVNATTAIATKVVPSVVTISASSGSAGGTGSGVILGKDGYVVTNTHVVTLDGESSDAKLSATTSDGRIFQAKLVGTDPTYDLAVIKLEDASGLTPIEFADSSNLNVGDQTVAIGAPLGLSNTVTTGIISALNRSIEIASSAAPAPAQGDGTEGEGGQGQEGNGQEGNGQEGPFYFDFGQGQPQRKPTSTISIAVIQTDAAINPGNSGGALVDSEGKLIGINVAIATAGGSSSGASGSIGVGFSIPANVVQRVSSEIIDNGSATHGLLGAMVAPASSIQGTTISGAYIDDVTDGGAAQQAGLRKGDVVTSFNGVPITDAIDLTAQVRAAAAGAKVDLTYVRGDKTQTATVTLGTLEQ